MNSEILTFGDPRRPQYVSALDLSSLFGGAPADPGAQRLVAALMQKQGGAGKPPGAAQAPSAAASAPLPPVRPAGLGVSPLPQPSDGPSPASAVTSALSSSGGNRYRPGFDPDQAAPDPGVASLTRATFPAGASSAPAQPAPSQPDLLARAATIPTALPSTGQPPQPALARANPYADLIPPEAARPQPPVPGINPYADLIPMNVPPSPDLLARAARVPPALPSAAAPAPGASASQSPTWWQADAHDPQSA